MAENRFGIQIDKGLSQSWQQQYIVASGTAAGIAAGTPTKLVTADASVAGVIVPMVDGDGIVTAMRFTGVSKDTSTETAAAAGVCNVWAPVPGILYRAKAKSSTAVDTQAEINALMGKKTLFDLTSANWTVDTATADALINCVVIAGGIPASSEVLFVYSPKGTIFDTSTAM